MDFRTMTVEAISKHLQQHEPTSAELSLLEKDRRTGVKRLVERCLAARNKEQQELERLQKMLAFEKRAWGKGHLNVAGVDEAGRGPLAGPVVAAAVIWPKDLLIKGINDSKLLSPARRAELYNEITDKAVAWSVGIGEVAEIDRVNILQATKLAMHRALSTLPVKPDWVLLDALKLEHLDCPQQGIVGGDRLSVAVAAASIIAKVTRDRWMCEMDKVFPGYSFAVHKGYATDIHRRALQELGPCPMHRKSFLSGVEFR